MQTSSRWQTRLGFENLNYFCVIIYLPVHRFPFLISSRAARARASIMHGTPLFMMRTTAKYKPRLFFTVIYCVFTGLLMRQPSPPPKTRANVSYRRNHLLCEHLICSWSPRHPTPPIHPSNSYLKSFLLSLTPFKNYKPRNYKKKIIIDAFWFYASVKCVRVSVCVSVYWGEGVPIIWRLIAGEDLTVSSGEWEEGVD